MKRIFILTIAMFLLVGCAHTLRVQPYQGEKANEMDGVIYALPRTIIEVTIPMMREYTQLTKFGGEFCEAVNVVGSKDLKFLQAGFGIDCSSYVNNYEQVKVNFRTGKPEINTRVEADPNKIFVVNTKVNLSQDLALNMELTEECLLCAGDATVTEHGYDYVVKTLEIAASAGKILMFGSPRVATKESGETKTDYILERAKAINDELGRIRRRKLGLISNQNATMENMEIFKLMLNELQKEEAAQLANLLKKQRSLWTAQLDMTPEKSFIQISLFKIDKKTGIFDANKDLHVPPAFKAKKIDISKATEVVITLERNSNQMVDKIMEVTRKNPRGFYYRIPAYACVTVSFNDTVKAKKRLQIAQLGRVVSLPPTRGTYKNNNGVTFHTETGALKKITMTSEAPPAEMISQVGTAGQSLLEARAASLQAQALADDELTKLQREYNLLLLKKQIEDLQAGTIPSEE